MCAAIQLISPLSMRLQPCEAHGTQRLDQASALAHSPVILPIPGTSSVAHLEENVAAAELELTAGELARLDEARVRT